MDIDYHVKIYSFAFYFIKNIVSLNFSPFQFFYVLSWSYSDWKI